MGMKDHPMEDDLSQNDKRISWLISRVTAAFKPWLKKKEMDRLDDDDQVVLMKEFLDHKETSVLYVFLSGSQPVVTMEPAEDFGSKKALYFLKRQPAIVKTENITQILQFGELHPQPLESLLYTQTHVNPSLLKIKENMEIVPERIHDQLRAKFDSFRSSLLVAQGLSEGKSQLPLPTVDLSHRGRDKDIVYQLESVVVGWTGQARHAIQLAPSSLFEPAHPFTKGVPSVLHEIRFWQQKTADLRGLEEQLATPTILKILDVLQTAGSSYYEPFQQLQKELSVACLEASDNLRFLTPLWDGVSSPVALLAGTATTQALPFNDLVEEKTFEKLFHFVSLLWEHSKYYNTPARVVVLIREVSNDVISSAKIFVDIDDLFVIDPDEAIEKLSTCLAVCGHFKSVYFKAKAKASKSSEKGPWRFHNNSLFTRLDAFLERCHDLLDVLETSMLFSKLDPDLGRVIVGGTNGPEACTAITSVFTDFTIAHMEFIKAPINLLDVEEPEFDEYFTTFRNNTKLLEKKLGSILATSLHDSRTLSSTFKLVDSFEGFLDRSHIQQEWLQRQVEVVKKYQDDLLAVQESITEQQQRDRKAADPRNFARALVATARDDGTVFPTGKHTRADQYERFTQVYDRMPPTAAKLAWARSLLDRINQPLERLGDVVSPSVKQMEIWNEAMGLHSTLVANLNGYLSQQANKWVDGVGGTQEMLKYSLLKKSGEILRVNFDGELTKLLKEVAYVEGFNEQEEGEKNQYDVPPSAKHVFTNTPMLRGQILKLEAMCNLYNSMKESMLAVERPLVEEEFKQCDDGLQSGVVGLTWVSDSVDDFIKEVTQNVVDISSVLQALSTTVSNIEKIIKQHIEEDKFLPLDPKDSKTMPLDDFIRKYSEYRRLKCESGVNRSTDISALLESGFTALNTLKVQKGSEPFTPDDECWNAYVQHVNGVVRSLVVSSVVHSLSNLKNQLNGEWLTSHSGIPLLDIKLILDQSDPEAMKDTFVPSLRGTTDSLEAMVLAWINDIKQDSGSFTRLDEPSENFYINITNNVECEELSSNIQKLVATSITTCETFHKQYTSFADLWNVPMQEAFDEFLGEHEPQAEDDMEKQITAKSFQAEFFSGASLEDYSKMIIKYDKIHENISALPDGQQCGWVRVDAKPIKLALRDYCSKWKAMYVQHLVKKTRNELTSFNTFIKDAERELEKPVDDGDLEGLKTIMKWIGGCKRVNDKAQVMFEPIREVLEMLKRHQCVGEDVLSDLEDLRRDGPEAWSALFKKSLNVREEFSKIQDQEADRVEEQAAQFQDSLEAFSEWFDTTGPFAYLSDTEQAYEEMDEIHLKLSNLEAEAGRIHAEQVLFDLAKTEFRLLKECRHKLKMLKGIWDLIAHGRAMFNFWNGTPFLEVNVDDLSDEVSKLFKQLKGPSTKAKSWKCFEGLHNDVKRMSLSLPLIQDLREDAMRERHWHLLFKETGHAGMGINPRSPSCTLEVLMSLGLHEHQDAVQNTVEKASKELQLESNINRVIATWETQSLSYTKDETLTAWVLAKIDDVVEVLDSDTNMLQQMQSNRFVDFFQEPVNKWMDNLGRIESTLQAWMDVQKRWVNLYPIFIISQDIRQSLPEDAKRFESADELYRELMDKVHTTTNVVEICCTDLAKKLLERDDGIEVVLSIILDVLMQCEKSLADYLESKKKIFPRFFFLADSDLVDILSKGSTPTKVMTHMSKVIDAIDTFTFVENDEEEKYVVNGFKSLQGETIAMPMEYCCEGAVESWLDGCVDSMQKTVKAKINDANASYMENPRVSWIFNHCCQAVVVASRLQFTWETNIAFNQLEDGNETALKDYLKVQQKQLSEEIRLVLGSLTPNDRAMLVHLITIDVHNRDVVQWLIDERAESDTHFTWQSQLRYHWDETKGCVIRICDSEFVHGHEYIGLCGCLVVTKLTDRCYITLTQALKLVQGGAPAGPAGTGKTETTKDLARNLGNACYVFNCSDQMDFRGLGRIFKGLAMSGCWGCFDEFNRISIEVLSVVATQVSSILYGIRTHKKNFKFANEEDISLNPSCGMFITMNPGYAGRTELPENIKSLFRPCAMVVPDIQNICEILLAAEGFVEAKDLAMKFVQLYKLNKELLSQQLHYDWGLRAVKSVLVIAGNLRRNDPELNERLVLLRALRDTNLAKLSKDDVYVFKGLIKALFPNMNVTTRIDTELQTNCIEACKDLSLLSGEADMFILKCLQLDELLGVRHSVFILGPAGCGKTECRNALKQAYTRQEPGKCKSRVINPKAITSNEMYGCAHEQTKEWKEGHLSHIFKEFSVLSKTNSCMKWVILDGIIDTEWIESMNTVMDDNKMLTLANNDRIPLTSSMRMVFEISQLRNASPATVSRAGILYINDTDLGWAPFKDKWLIHRKDEKERNYLDSFFDAYLPVFDYFKRIFTTIIPVTDMSIIQSLCSLLDSLLAVLPSNTSQDIYERYFCFAMVWAFGGPLSTDGRVDYRAMFSKWWIKEMQTKVKICDEKFQVFDFYISPDREHEFHPWSEMVHKYHKDPEVPFSHITVETIDTVRTTYLMDLLIKTQRSVMLVGTVGTGKSCMTHTKLRSLDATEWVTRTISFNAQSTARALQMVLEANLERGGRKWHPPARKQLMFFIDDINMPLPDRYGTQEAVALLRQYMDYGFWFDRNSPGVEKHVTGIQLVASMNHKAGSFTILDRMQRWFSVFSVNLPSTEDLTVIYASILGTHLKNWSKEIRNLTPSLVNATIELHQTVREHFLPTATKFHYQWNLREMANIFQGMISTVKSLHDNDPMLLIRLWRHECERTFKDRMVSEQEMNEYDAVVTQVVTKHFNEVTHVDDILKEPNIWAPFGQQGDDLDIYDSIDTYEQLSMFLEGKLEEYNDDSTKARMDLVLFKQAMSHVAKICRILSHPKGNALLIGVGGSGKRSLSRLAAFINELDVYSILVTSTYNGDSFRRNISDLYLKCGKKNQRFVFIMTDAQVVCPDQLVVLNDMLNSGHVANLFEPDAAEELCSAMVPELRQRQHPDYNNKDVCWNHFLSKVQTNLHTTLCFSPVGQQLATWCRQFPAISNTTVIDWFHPWPEDALMSVSSNFLLASDSVLSDEPDLASSCGDTISDIHLFVTSLAEEFRVKAKRYCYTTPKSYMEMIGTYKRMLEDKRTQVAERKRRLVDGLYKIKHAQEQVSELQVKFKDEDIEVRNATAEVNTLMEQVSVDKAACQEEADRAELEKIKTEKLLIETDALRADAERDLAAAQPVVERAKEALKGLNKASLTELKSFTKPPQEVLMVTAAVMCLTAHPSKIPRAEKAKDWSNAKKMMSNVSAWLKELEDFGANMSHNIPQPCIDAIQQWVKHPDFDADKMASKSEAASCLSAWVCNMDAYHTLRCQIRPKEERLSEANERLEHSKMQFKRVQDHVASLNGKLDDLVEAHNVATEKSRVLKQKAESTRLKMNIAERLVSGLADENVRWGKTTDELGEGMQLLAGDVLMASAFISYAGPFNSEYRERLVAHINKNIKSRGIPHTEGLDFVTEVLTSEAEVAGWNNEGLPTDRISTENGAIVKNAKRWPLLVDPQLQGITWIKAKEEKHGLIRTQQGSPTYLEDIITCLEKGLPCLIENLPESIDPILEPVLGKEFTRKGATCSCKVGDLDVHVDVGSFRLYLQTKHPNPHYKPELNAQTTLVNFMVTEAGLEDQLLAVVVNMEQPELEEKRVALIRQMNQYKIDLSNCEDKLLYELSNATGELLENVVLIQNLEQTKKQAGMIAKALIEDRVMQEELMARRLVYKPAAIRGSLLYFEIDRLSKISSLYQYSLDSFMGVFNKAMKKADVVDFDEEETMESVEKRRMKALITSITETVCKIQNPLSKCKPQLYAYVSRGLFEKHKVIFSSLVCFSILKQQGDINVKQLDFLLTGGRRRLLEQLPAGVSEWCTPAMWSAINSLAEVPGPTGSGTMPSFDQLPDDLQQHNRWKLWTEQAKPEDEKLPTDWRNLDEFQRLLIIRCLRPDRLIASLNHFVSIKLGKFFTTDTTVPLGESFEDAGTCTPLFFILSPGVDPARKVEALAIEKGFSYDKGNFFNVSLGQGQEERAMQALQECFKNGGWAMLSNIHLARSWLSELENTLDKQANIYNRELQYKKRVADKKQAAEEARKAREEMREARLKLKEAKEGESEEEIEEEEAVSEQAEIETEEEEEPTEVGHPDFRLFLSAEPSASNEQVIPIGILQRCIKLTNEPPSGMKANMVRALAEFKDEPWENSCKPADFKAVLFSMCWFHSIVVERKKFGKLGWNREYPFNMGDLSSCVNVLNNYMEERPHIPWDDLRYVFGEIIYGGHITDDWDRRLCSAYLEQFIKIEVTDGLELCENFTVPTFNSHHEAVQCVEQVPSETPALYGLHPHAELGYHIDQAEYLFRTINELQPKSTGNTDGHADTSEAVQAVVDDILNNYIQDKPHDLTDIAERLEDDKTPQQHVFYQECERMNMLQNLMKATLQELNQGLRGALSMSEPMLELFESIRLDKVPERWQSVSFMSKRGLGGWCLNMVTRNSQLIEWGGDLLSPKVTRLDYLFNPMSYITSICQHTAMLNNYELDQMDIVCEPLKRMCDSIDHSARDGAHVFGLKMEGARWDLASSTIDDSKGKELFSVMPVITIKALPSSKINRKEQYPCPLYKTQQRGTGYVTTLHLRTKQPPIKWIIAGVAAVLDVDEM